MSELVIELEGRLQTFVGPGTWLVGRDPSAVLVVNDERASRQHAQLTYEGTTWNYVDLGSSNGSYLEGRRLARLPLTPGLSIRLGDPVDGTQLQIISIDGITTSATKPKLPQLAIVLGVVALLGLGTLGVTRILPPTNSSDANNAQLKAANATLDRSAVVALGKAATVRIDTSSSRGVGVGTGVILVNNQILTAAHVIEGASRIQVSFDGVLLGTAKVLRVSEPDDLAVIVLANMSIPGSKGLDWGDSDALTEGEDLVAIGYASGLTIDSLSVKLGVVSRLYVDGTTKFIQTDVSLNPGMSGGPLLNTRGQLVGIADKINARPGYAGLSFAVASSTARAFVENSR